MGKSTKLKQQVLADKEEEFVARATQYSREAKLKTAPSNTPLISFIEYFRPWFVSDEHTFVLKTRSANKDKQLLELVNYMKNINVQQAIENKDSYETKMYEYPSYTKNPY